MTGPCKALSCVTPPLRDYLFCSGVCSSCLSFFESEHLGVFLLCPAIFFHKSLSSRAETSCHLPHLTEILLVCICCAVLKYMAESSKLLYRACAEKVHQIFIKLNHSLGRRKMVFSPHVTICVVDFLFLWFPPCEYFPEFMRSAEQ